MVECGNCHISWIIFKDCIDKDVYDADILVKYCEEEIDTSKSVLLIMVVTFLFTYAGLRQVADKYLVQDRSSGKGL